MYVPYKRTTKHAHGRMSSSTSCWVRSVAEPTSLLLSKDHVTASIDPDTQPVHLCPRWALFWSNWHRAFTVVAWVVGKPMCDSVWLSCGTRFARESASLSPRDYVIMGFGCCDALGWANQRANQQFHTLTSRPKSYRLYHQSMSCSQKFRCDPSNPVDFIMSLASPILQREVWLNKVLATEL